MSFKNNNFVLRHAFLAGVLMASVGSAWGSTASEMYRTKAISSLADGQLDVALQQLDQAVKADSGDNIAHYYRGIVLSRMERYPEAVPELEMAQSNGVGFKLIDFELGYAYYRNKQLPEAEAALTRAWRKDPAHAPTNYYLGMVHYQQQHYEACLEPLDTAAINDKKFAASAAYMRGEALHQLKRDDEAVEVLDAAITAYPNSIYTEHSKRLLGQLQRNMAKKPWSLGITTGLSVDSNVGLIADDRILPPSIPQQSDGRFQVGVDAKYKLVERETGQFAIGYRFFNSFHETLSQYNLRNNSVSADLSGITGTTRYGIGYQYMKSDLDKQDYRVSNMLSPNVMFMHNEHRASLLTLMWRMDDYKQQVDNGRDGNAYEGGYRHYWLKGDKQYTYVGLDLLRTDADDKNYSNNGYGANAGIEFPLDRLSIKLGLQYSKIDYYDSVTDRNDDQWRAGLNLTMPMGRDVALLIGVNATDNRSTDKNYEYTRNVLDMNVRWQL